MSGILTSETPSMHDFATHSASRRSWLTRAFSKPTSHFVGIDFSIPTIHVATFENRESGLGVGLSNPTCHRYDLPIEPFATVTPQSIAGMIELMCDALPRCVDGEKNTALLSLPPSWIHYETFATEPNSSLTTAIPAELQRRCDQMFGSSAFRSHSHVGQWPISRTSAIRMVAATAREAACKIAQRVSSIGYDVQGILPHGLALALATPALTTLNPACIILLNRVGGLVSITKNGHCSFCRTLPICPKEFAYADDVDALDPWIEQVATETIATMNFSARNQVAIDQDAIVMLCGEIANVEGIDLALADRLRRSVATWMLTQFKAPMTEACCDEIGCRDTQRSVAISLAYAAAVQSGKEWMTETIA